MPLSNPLAGIVKSACFVHAVSMHANNKFNHGFPIDIPTSASVLSNLIVSIACQLEFNNGMSFSAAKVVTTKATEIALQANDLLLSYYRHLASNDDRLDYDSFLCQIEQSANEYASRKGIRLDFHPSL